jgi:hypothetical protein
MLKIKNVKSAIESGIQTMKEQTVQFNETNMVNHAVNGFQNMKHSGNPFSASRSKKSPLTRGFWNDKMLDASIKRNAKYNGQ